MLGGQAAPTAPPVPAPMVTKGSRLIFSEYVPRDIDINVVDRQEVKRPGEAFCPLDRSLLPWGWGKTPLLQALGKLSFTDKLNNGTKITGRRIQDKSPNNATMLELVLSGKWERDIWQRAFSGASCPMLS